MDFSSMTLAELREVARSKQIKSITTLKKAELVQLLQSLEGTAKESHGEGKVSQAGSRTPRKVVQRFEPKAADGNSGHGENRQNKGNVRAEARTERMPGRMERTSGKNEARGERAVIRSDARSGERMGTSTESRQPEMMRYESRPAVRTEVHGESRMVRPEVQEPQGYEAENRQERFSEEKRSLNIRNEAFTMEEFQKLENPELTALDSGNVVNGILEIMEGYGFIRSANYLPGENDVYVSPAQIRRFNLKTGDILNGNTRVKTQAEKFSALLYINSVNGYHPLEAQKRRPFEELTPIFPEEKIQLEQNGSGIPMRIVDVIAPIGKGQRGMIVSPPKAGKTTLLKQMAKTISRNYKDMHMLVLLIDERPEEVTDIRESIEGPNVEVIYSTFDELPEHHKRVAEMVLDRAKRLVEHKKDVVILLDSITRLARAYNLIVPPSGRTLTGGLDPAALHMPKKFFGAARNIREGGSLTILATALVETGSKMDDVVFEEFKGTGNMELVLDRKLSEKRIFPAIDISKSGTRREDLLLSKEEQDAMYLIRREISGTKGDEAIEEVLKLFVRTRNNSEFLNLVQKSLGRR
ncbi:MAG: transcription termination factor Rho [Bacteroides sp.]|nr:transcription termination factor Rho [Bacteroides sp.]MCM1549215.1 transcription termination factor Rho [Clostridium sp.]